MKEFSDVELFDMFNIELPSGKMAWPLSATAVDKFTISEYNGGRMGRASAERIEALRVFYAAQPRDEKNAISPFDY